MGLYRTYSLLLVREKASGNVQLKVRVRLVQVVILDGLDENGVIGLQGVEVLVDVALLSNFLLPLANADVTILTSGVAVLAGNPNESDRETYDINIASLGCTMISSSYP